MDNLVVQNSINETSIGGVLKHLLNHPLDSVILRWNWKSAFLSALLRAPIFFFAYQKEGLGLAIGAASAQFLVRTAFGGIYGAIIQAFSKVDPAWHALLTVPLVLASLSHLIEFIVQTFYDFYYGSTSGNKAILVSIIISALSAVFNLFAMRRGALLVKDEQQQSLWKDLKSFPYITFELIVFAPMKIYEMFHRREYLKSILMAVVLSFGTGLVTGLLSGKFVWGIVTGGSILALMIITVAIMSAISPRNFREIEATGE